MRTSIINFPRLQFSFKNNPDKGGLFFSGCNSAHFIIYIKGDSLRTIPPENWEIFSMGIYSFLLPIFLFISVSLAENVGEKPDEFKCDVTSRMTRLMALIGFKGKVKNPDPNAKIILQLITPTHPSQVIAKNGDISGIVASDFQYSRETVIISHGYQGNGALPWLNSMAEAYIQYKPVNVIIVDWGILAGSKNYIQAARNVERAAQQVVELLNEAVKIFGGNAGNWGPMHLIGFSLGAHVVAIIADRFNKLQTGWRIPRITGLDPAAPCWERNEMRLDPSDADFVDIIHTNGNKLPEASFGMKQSIGHIDYFVNGGELQPGCRRPKGFWAKLKTKIKDLDYGVGSAICSHNRAPQYFIASLEMAAKRDGSGFYGIKWPLGDLCTAVSFTREPVCGEEQCVMMGINTTSGRGRYFVPTGRHKPFDVIHYNDKKAIVKVLQSTIKAAVPY